MPYSPYGPELSRLNNLVADIDEQLGANRACNRRCYSFMLDCLALIRHLLPPVAIAGIAVTERLLQNGFAATDWPELEAPRRNCWAEVKRLETIPGSEAQIAAVRAALFATYPPDGKDDLVDVLSVFLEFANEAEPHFVEQEQLLRKHFAPDPPSDPNSGTA